MTNEQIQREIELSDRTVPETNIVPERCKNCGYDGHDADACEYPFPQGHAAQQKRMQDWSRLAHQVVGGEIP